MADGYIVTPVGPFPAAVGATFGTFTTKQDISPLPVPVILPYQLRLGSKIKIEAEGEWSTTGTATFTPELYYGITLDTNTGKPLAVTGTLAAAGAQSVVSGASFPWRLEWRGLVTKLGSAGEVVGQGDIEAALTSLTAFTSTAIPITLALRTVVIPTTGPLAIGIAAACGTSSASNTIKCNNLSVMLLN
jgi:hypothetical protein